MHAHVFFLPLLSPDVSRWTILTMKLCLRLRDGDENRKPYINVGLSLTELACL